MDDIAPKLIEEVNKDFDKNVSNKKVQELEKKAAAGNATYDDAYKYAEEVGKARSKALLKNVTSETLPNGTMYYNIADRLMNDSLSTDHDIVTEYAAKAQEAINKKNGISLKAQTADLDQDRIDGFVNGLSGDGGNPIEEVLWKLGEPVITHARTVVDDTVKKNAEFQNKAGIRATVTRKAAAKCCDWCADLDGDYTYPNVDRAVFQRHDNCRCSLDYEGKKLTAYKSVSGKYNTFRDPEGTRRSLGSTSSSNMGNSASRKEWHGYKTKEKYVNRFAKREERRRLDEKALKTINDYDKVKSRIERAEADLIKREFVKQLDAHPEMLGDFTPESLKDTLKRAGYEVKALSRGNFKGISFEDGGGYKVNFDGNGILSYHPEERSHHDGPYYKISNSMKGIRRYDLNGKEIVE